MRWSHLFIPTLKEVPQDAEITSHQLMLRAGLIRKLSSGLYSYLPLGLRALQRVEHIVREEMNRAGGQEVLMPAVQPADLWRRSGRYESMTDVMFCLKDKNDRDMVLGPTHEEVITEIVAREINSYRQLPRNFYQIQTKFRDEIRPRFGLMRSREFIMKDAYSFDVDDPAAMESYAQMYAAYERIFARCGLATTAVEADTGAIGGSHSHEFMVMAEAGEDGIAVCDSCGYSANLEKASSKIEPRNDPEDSAMPELVDTPNLSKIAEVSKFFDNPEHRCIKTMIYVTGIRKDDGSSDEKTIAISVPGDREVNEIKLGKALKVDWVTLADVKTVIDVTGSKPGFAGPIGLEIPVYADERLRGIQGATAGPNVADKHYTHVNLERDANVAEWVDVCTVKEGDGCPTCDAKLVEKRGIEVGHVFKLGTKYSEKLGANYLDSDGKQHDMVMGCYGIGVSRTLQAAIEQCHDKDGIIWPFSLAPFHVHIAVLDIADDAVTGVVDELVTGLEFAGLDVLIDDRDGRPGGKFKDADLIGMPIRVTVGKRGLDKGIVEIKPRATTDREDVAPDVALARILAIAEQLKDACS